MKAITEAAKIIAYDNGAVNRLTTEEEVLKSMLGSLSAFTPEELTEVEAFLAGLSADDLLELCAGEYGAIYAPDIVETVLETMFENM